MTPVEAFNLNRLILRAAVSGRFAPEKLMADLPESQVEGASGPLSLVCDEDPVGAGRAWILQPAVRRQALAGLADEAAVKAALKGAPPPASGDLFATALRRLLQGRPLMVPKGAGEAELEAAQHAALQFAQAAPVVDRTACNEAFNQSRSRIAQRRRAQALKTVLPRDLVGRRDELAALRAFATGKERDVRPKLVTGVGGVGKSALVAAVVQEIAQGGRTTILLDFDRADLSAGDPLPIAREIFRQLESAWLARTEAPFRKAAQIIAEIRTRIRELEARATREKADSQLAFVFSELLPRLRGLPLRVRKAGVLVVMDSFEVIAGRGPVVVRRILKFEQYLRSEAVLDGVRTVISGREAPFQSDAELKRRCGDADRRIRVEGLGEEHGALLLKRLDTTRRFPAIADRRRAAAALGGHPLALMVLERFARDQSEAEIAELLADLEANKGFAAEFAQAFVYTRILDRLHDPELAALAHPGLVLREVSADLIRLVLAGRTELGDISKERAERLLKKLAGQFWLVEPLRKGVWRHIPDLRRLMLPGLFAGPTARDEGGEAERKRKLKIHSIKVCHAASAFYAKGPKSDDPAYGSWRRMAYRDRKAQATYYRALAGIRPPPTMDRTAAAELRAGIGSDFNDLPPAWRAVVKVSLGELKELTDAERATLQGSTARAAKRVADEVAITSGREEEVIATAVLPGPVGEAQVEDLEQQIRAAFALGEFEMVVPHAEALLHHWSAGRISSESLRQAEQFQMSQSAPWLAALILAAQGRMGFWEELPDRGPPTQGDILLTILAAGHTSRGMRLDMMFRGDRGRLSGVDGLRLAAKILGDEIKWSGPEISVEQTALALGDPAVLTALAEMLQRQPKSGIPTLLAPIARGAPDLATYNDVYRKPIPAGLGAVRKEDLKRPELWQALRGLTPELHETAARLLAAMPDHGRMELIEAVAETARTWPRDLWFHPAPGQAVIERGPRRTFESPHALIVVQAADRCGVLLELLNKLPTGPSTETLRSMHDVITKQFFRPFGEQ